MSGRTPDDGKAIKSCAMVIGAPNEFVGQFHDRMPVVLEADNFEQWERGGVREAAELMRPAGEEVLQARPVSRRVNSSKADDLDATLIERVEIAA